MRSLTILVLAGLVFASSVAIAEEEAAAQPRTARLRLSVEPGYVWLSGNDEDVLEGGAAYGFTAAYRLTPAVYATLPFLMSFHKGSDLPDGETAKLSLYSITPGLTFTTSGRLAMWFFLGAGVTFKRTRVEVVNTTATESDSALGTRMSAGINYTLWRNLSLGASGSVLSASAESLQPNGQNMWETSFYYACLGQLSYAF